MEGQRLHIVMEFVSEGDLTGRMKHIASTRNGSAGGSSSGSGSSGGAGSGGSGGVGGGELTEDEVMWYFVQICLALHHLHAMGILHRDLKAQNIFIATGDIVKLGVGWCRLNSACMHRI